MSVKYEKNNNNERQMNVNDIQALGGKLILPQHLLYDLFISNRWQVPFDKTERIIKDYLG